MKLGNLGEQIFLRSMNAFNAIKYAGNEYVYANEWYERKRNRDITARNAYRSMNREAYIHGELYMVRIIDEEVKPGDARLQ